MASTPRVEVTSTRDPDVQRQYEHDMRRVAETFGAARPCPMGTLVFREAPEDPHAPVLGENLYPYINFADQVVRHHQLLVPQLHVPSLEALREVDEEAWKRFYLAQDRLRAEGKALFIHGLGSAAMSAPSHVHVHVFTLAERITRIDYDRSGHLLRIQAGSRTVVDSERGTPRTPRPWVAEPSACDDHYERVFGPAT